MKFSAIKVGTWEDAVIEMVPENKVRAKAGWTQVFVPVIPAIQRWFNELPKRFLHFSDFDCLGSTVMLPKKDRNLEPGNAGPMIYRRGVFVREMDSASPSIFDYQLENLNIDECRNADEANVRVSCGQAIADAPVEVLREYLEKMVRGHVWEEVLDSYTLCYHDNDTIVKRKLNWQLAWSECFGDGVACHQLVADLLERKGKKPIIIKNPSLLSALREYEVPHDHAILSKMEEDGLEPLPATEDVLAVVKETWDNLLDIGMTMKKDMPKTHCFRKFSEGGQVLSGYYLEGSNDVFINIDIGVGKSDKLYDVVFEEIAHYITGAYDFTRDFQNFNVSCTQKFMRRGR